MDGNKSTPLNTCRPQQANNSTYTVGSRENSANSAWHFVKFGGSPRQITVNFAAVDGQLKENQFRCSKYPIYRYYLLVFTIMLSVSN